MPYSNKEKQREYYRVNKEKIAEYYQLNKEKKSEYSKKYYELNKEKRGEQVRKYREENKEQIGERNRKWREENKEQIREHKREQNKKRRAHCREYLGGKCVVCGTTHNLQFDHIKREGKKYEISTKLTNKWDNLKEELDKCQLLCAPCHLEKTASEWTK